MKILIAIFIVIVISILINSFKLILNKITDRFKLAKMIYKIMPVFELLIWLIIIFWIFNYLFEEYVFYNFLVASLIFVTIILVSWYYLRNFIAGIFFRLQNKFVIGDIIQFSGITGEIKNMTSGHLTIEAQEGQIMRIPYSKLSNEIISERTELNTFHESKIVLKTSKELGIDGTSEAIISSILLSPWHKTNRKPEVRFSSEEKEIYLFELHLITKSEEHLHNLVNSLKKEYEVG